MSPSTRGEVWINVVAFVVEHLWLYQLLVKIKGIRDGELSSEKTAISHGSR